LRHLANRLDAWGGYRPPEESGKPYTKADGSQGKLGGQTTRKGPLTLGVLARHFRAGRREEVVGLHSTSTTNTSRWFFLDIDWHGPNSTAPAVNWRAALSLHEDIAALGFRPLLLDSNGAGGYHLGAILAEPVPTPRVFAVARRLASGHARHGLPAPPETFPKQVFVRPGGFGNWLRLPGRHHTREHWSRVWDGTRWLKGHDAIDFILSMKGDPASLVPEAPAPARPVTDTAATRPAPPRRRPGPAGLGEGRGARAANYLGKLPNLGEGQGRDDVAYGFACFLVRDLLLADDVALAWLVRWDAGNSPPKGEARLREIVASAHAYGQRPYGSGLRANACRAGRGRRRQIITGTSETW
jgi:hypothetical protein